VRYLLDTHVWLWQLGRPEMLSRRSSAALGDPGSELFLSPISVWEALVLARKGRIKVEGKPGDWIREALRRTPARMAGVTHEIVIASESIPGMRISDPADRFLAATCLVHDLTLISSDRALRRLEAIRTLW